MSAPQIKVNAFLANLPLFRELSPPEIDRLAVHTRDQRIAKGEILFQKGDPCHGFYCVVHGQIKLAFPSIQGQEKVIELIGTGQSFGEAVMFLERPYPVYAQALSDTLLLHVAKNAVFEELERDPKFARKMLAGLSIRLHGLVNDVEAYSLRSCTERVIGYLLQHEADAPSGASQMTIQLPTSKNVLASRLNITPETFSRILHDLSNKGLIAVSGKEITVNDLERLRGFEQ